MERPLLDRRLSAPLEGEIEVRVEVDLLATAFTSLIEFYGPLRHRSPPQVAARARSLGRRVPLAPLMSMLSDPLRAGVPDFFGLPESQGSLTLEERLERLRAVGSDRVADDLATYAKIPGVRLEPYRDWADKPERALGATCALLRSYWTEVVAEVYPDAARRIARQVRLLRDVSARDGMPAAVTSTNWRGTISGDSASVAFMVPKPTWPRNAVRRQTLVLKPMICSPITTVTNFPFQAEPTLTIAVSTAALSSWRPGAPGLDADVPLTDLIGTSRARLIKALTRRSSTTTELAADLGIALSTVSHHLGRLAGAGLVGSVRSGASVTYHLTDRGFRFLQL